MNRKITVGLVAACCLAVGPTLMGRRAERILPKCGNWKKKRRGRR